ncbi:MAG: hypothetical protein LJE84_08385 [Gammaproteobacteria bacterium]|nr:hypothetical protein [Gammaproteobacteria bacterium]
MRDYLTQHFERLKAHPNHWVRKSWGIGLVIGGILGPVLPILGTWMLPLGLLLLAVDFPWAQRLSDRLHRWGQRLMKNYRRFRAKGNPPPASGDHSGSSPRDP